MNARQTFDRAITIADNERRAADAARVAAEARAAAAAQVYTQTKILMVRPGADKQTMYLKVLRDDPGMIEIVGDMLEI